MTDEHKNRLRNEAGLSLLTMLLGGVFGLIMGGWRIMLLGALIAALAAFSIDLVLWLFYRMTDMPVREQFTQFMDDFKHPPFTVVPKPPYDWEQSPEFASDYTIREDGIVTQNTDRE